MADQTLQFIITAQNNAKQAFNEVENQLTKLQAATEKMKKSWSNTVNASKELAAGFAVAGAAAGAFGLSAIKAAANQEQTIIAFETMLGSAEKAATFYKDLVNFAARTPFELKGLEQSSKQLLAYGFAQEEILPNLKSLGDISAGVGMDKLPYLILAYGQVRAATKLTGAELRQFTEAGVPLLGELANYYGKTAGEIQEMISKGEVGFPAVQAALQNLTGEGGRFNDLMDKQSKSLGGMWSNLQDAWEQFLRGQGAQFIEWAKQVVAILIDIVQNQLPAFIGQIQSAGEWMQKNKDIVIIVASALTAMLIPAIISATTAFVAMVVALGPFAIAGGALASFVIGIKEGNVVLTAISGAIMAMFIPAIIKATAALWAMIAPIIPVLGTLAVALAPYLIGGAIIGGLVAGIVWLIKNWDTAKKFLSETWEGLKIIAGETFGPMIENIQNLFQGLWDGLKVVWDGIVETVKSAINGVIGLINKMIDAINSIKIKIPKIEYFPGRFFGGMEIRFPQIPTIPELAQGGIITRPTLAMIGEAGPEAVLPLSSAYNPIPAYAGANINVYIQGGYYLDRDAADEIGEKIIQKLKQTMKL